MGKPRAFIDVKRKIPGYRPVEERRRDFRAVERRLSDTEIKEQASRCMDCGIPFCHGCGCPLGNLIPEWNELVFRGHWDEALRLLYSTNNFPEFTGRICPALCEASCTAGLVVDPVAIRQIEISLIEKGFRDGLVVPRPPAKRSGHSVAVIGSGPAGLAVADQLNRMGHLVTVYEKDEEPGGIMRFGIPDFKMEKSIIRRRVDLMVEEGVVFETNVLVGEDVSASFLKKRFDAICLACGSRSPRDLKVPGRDFKGIYFAMDFLSAQNRALETGKFPEEMCAKGRKVLVVGGGDTGSDCVGTSIRQEAVSVTQVEIMPRPSEDRPASTPWPQWPAIMRTSSSHLEGCERKWGVTAKSFSCDHKGRVNSANTVEVEWDSDAQGRPVSFKERPGSEGEIEADLVLLCMGFVGPEKPGLLNSLGLAYDGRGNVQVDKDFMSSVPGVFAAGDVASGQSLVVRAIAQGRKAAEGVDRYLAAKPLKA